MSEDELQQVRDAVEAALAEFEQLMYDKEWFVTNVVDQLEEAQDILLGCSTQELTDEEDTE